MSDLWTHADWKLVFGTLAASVAGSFHCVAMCGGFASIASSQGQRSSWLYQFGRLIGYASLGALAGALGQTAFTRLWVSELGFAAGVVLGAFLVLLGLRIATGKKEGSRGEFAFRGFRDWAYPRALRAKPNVRPLFLGACSVLLPCGWIYSFVVVALATESAWKGGLVLLAFWMGTLPWMLGSGFLAEWALGKIGNRAWIHRVVAFLMIGAGLATMVQKLEARLGPSATEARNALQCHQ